MKTPDIRAARNHSNQEATVGAMLPAQQAAVAHDTTKSIESPDVLVRKKKVSVRRNEDDQDQAQELAFDQTSAEVTDGTDAQPMLLAQASTETRTDVGAGATQQPVFASPSDEAVAAEMATAEGMTALEWAALALGGLGIGGVAAAAAASAEVARSERRVRFIVEIPRWMRQRGCSARCVPNSPSTIQGMEQVIFYADAGIRR